MAQRKLILTVTAVLLLAIGVFGVYRNNQLHPKSTAANAVVTTGVSIEFDAPLKSDAVLTITDSSDKTVVKRSLEAKAQRFNINLDPGVYTIDVQLKDQAPTPTATATVTNGRLSLINFSVPSQNGDF